MSIAKYLLRNLKTRGAHSVTMDVGLGLHIHLCSFILIMIFIPLNRKTLLSEPYAISKAEPDALTNNFHIRRTIVTLIIYELNQSV